MILSLRWFLCNATFWRRLKPPRYTAFNPLPDAIELPGGSTPFSARACDGPVRRPARKDERCTHPLHSAEQGGRCDPCGKPSTRSPVGEKSRLAHGRSARQGDCHNHNPLQPQLGRRASAPLAGRRDILPRLSGQSPDGVPGRTPRKGGERKLGYWFEFWYMFPIAIGF